MFTRNPSILNQLLIAFMSQINLTYSPINVFCIVKKSILAKQFSNLFKIALGKIFVSTLTLHFSFLCIVYPSFFPDVLDNNMSLLNL